MKTKTTYLIMMFLFAGIISVNADEIKDNEVKKAESSLLDEIQTAMQDFHPYLDVQDEGRESAIYFMVEDNLTVNCYRVKSKNPDLAMEVESFINSRKIVADPLLKGNVYFLSMRTEIAE